MAGMAIAIGTTVALLGIAESFEQSTVQSFAERGVDIVVLEKGVLDQLSCDLHTEYGDRIRDLPGVAGVAPGLLELVDYSHTGTVMSVLLQGWEPGTFLLEGLVKEKGRLFDEMDKGVVLLGTNLADVLKKDVGDVIEIQRKQFEVIGVVKSFNFFENGCAFLPLAELQELMGRSDSVTGFSVRLDPKAGSDITVEGVRQEIEELTDDTGVTLGMSAVATQDYANQSMHIRVVRAMAWAMSLIALVVGAVGTLNTMLMSVVERIKEISILRAIGWKRGRIAWMILGECFLLSLVGALLGTIGAAALLKWLAYYPMTRTFIQGDLPPIVILKGLALASAVALFGGGYPAWRATRLTPVEGLSHE